MKGRAEINNEYLFNSGKEDNPLPEKYIVKRLPEKYQVLSGKNNKLIFDVDARAELGEFLFG